SEYQIADSAAPILDDKGDTIGVVLVFRDVTEEYRVQEALRESEARFKQIANVSDDVYIITDMKDWSVLYVNPAYERIWGRPVQDLYEDYRVTDEGIHPDDRLRIQEAWMRMVKQGDRYEEEFRVIRPDGSLRWVRSRAYPVSDENGQVYRIAGIVHDITEEKLAEEALQSSEERFRALYDNNPNMLFTVDETGKVLSVNQFGIDQLGYSKDQLVGEPMVNVIYEQDRSLAQENLKQCFAELDKVHNWELRKIRQDGSDMWMRETVRVVDDIDGKPTALIVSEDITETRQLSEQLSFQASHDALTGLVNRREFERRAERLFATVKQDKSEHALCFMDLDQFKVVNDTCGHVAGDEMLRQLSSVLESAVRHRDTLARLGGDEFGVLMEHCSLDGAHRVATSLLTAIQDYQFSWEERSFRVGVSMGLVPLTTSTPNLTELLKNADIACYMAKDKGRNRVHVYHGEDSEIAQRHGEMQWVTRISQALEEDRFCLHAQIIVPLDGSSYKHYELLIRMIDEKGQLIPPGAFLPATERYNLITNIDRWVIENAFRLLVANPRFLEQVDYIAINLSGQSLADEEFKEYVMKQLQDTGIGGEKICFEITETAAISNLNMATKFISALKELGCRFSLDDFGSGLSSFGYLKNLQVDYLKIDGMFVKDIVEDPIDHAMVKSINEIGQVMGMKTIAEFVENDEIKGMLREIGVNYAQGYGIGKPQPLDELLRRANNVTDIKGRKI
ncbi:MAG: EAL domain-containing protein, partial [Candidatus Poribacteria bacterium]